MVLTQIDVSLYPIILTGATTLLFFVLFRLNNRRIASAFKQLPGPPTVPVFGNALLFLAKHEDYEHIFYKLVEQYRSYPLFRLWVGNNPVIIGYRDTIAEAILSSNKLIDKAYEYSFLHPWLGTGLLTSTGGKWHSRRKMLTPAFHFKIMEDFLEIFCEQAKIFLEKIREANETYDEGFDIFPFITRCALDIICEAAMGQGVNAQEDIDSEYIRAIYDVTAIIQDRQISPWLQPDLIFNLLPAGAKQKKCLDILHGFTDRVIRERRGEYAHRKANDLVSTKRLAFLDLLLEVSREGSVLTDADIREEVDTFMFEGHDTTAAGVGWCLFLLGHHPEIQSKVQKEIDKVFSDDIDRNMTMKDLAELKYLECTIKEALRLFPSVPTIARSLMEDITVDGYKIPAGCTVALMTYFLHRDPKHFPDPEVFNPDRFLPENVQGRPPYAYVPFSAGPRNCIGQKFALMEEKVVISSLLRKFSVKSVEKREGMQILAELILRPKNGFKVKLFPR